MASKATAVWTGSLKEGKGTISTATGVLHNANYSFATRFEGATTGTTPEEMIAAAHASCFSMALGAQLGGAGLTPTRLKPRQPSLWPRLMPDSPLLASLSLPRPRFPEQPRKSLTRLPPTPKPAAPSRSSSPTTPRSRWTPSSSSASQGFTHFISHLAARSRTCAADGMFVSEFARISSGVIFSCAPRFACATLFAFG